MTMVMPVKVEVIAAMTVAMSISIPMAMAVAMTIADMPCIGSTDDTYVCIGIR